LQKLFSLFLSQYQSLYHQNETASNVTGLIDEGLPSDTASGAISLEIWNDVFLHTAKDSKDDIAIILMNTHGLFDRNASSDNSLKVFLLGSLLSSIYVLNFPDFLENVTNKYLEHANKLKKYDASKSKGISKDHFMIFWDSLVSLVTYS